MYIGSWRKMYFYRLKLLKAIALWEKELALIQNHSKAQVSNDSTVLQTQSPKKHTYERPWSSSLWEPSQEAVGTSPTFFPEVVHLFLLSSPSHLQSKCIQGDQFPFSSSWKSVHAQVWNRCTQLTHVATAFEGHCNYVEGYFWHMTYLLANISFTANEAFKWWWWKLQYMKINYDTFWMNWKPGLDSSAWH